jgi:hypothetical protein
MATRWNEPNAKWNDGSTWASASAESKIKRMTKLIKLGLSRFNIVGLIAYLQPIITKMTGNTTFTTLATKTTALGTAVTALETANTNYNAALSTANQLMIVRDNAVITVENAAQDLAAGAEGVTKDPALLKSGGWDLVSGTTTPVGPMSAPANFHVTAGDNPGEVDAMCDPQKGVQTHIGEWATTPDGPWTQFYVGKKSSCAATSLTSGALGWFRMAAVGAAGRGPWAGPISKRVP